jgi:hypothetical protein
MSDARLFPAVGADHFQGEQTPWARRDVGNRAKIVIGLLGVFAESSAQGREQVARCRDGHQHTDDGHEERGERSEKTPPAGSVTFRHSLGSKDLRGTRDDQS